MLATTSAIWSRIKSGRIENSERESVPKQIPTLLPRQQIPSLSASTLEMLDSVRCLRIQLLPSIQPCQNSRTRLVCKLCLRNGRSDAQRGGSKSRPPPVSRGNAWMLQHPLLNPSRLRTFHRLSTSSRPKRLCASKIVMFRLSLSHCAAFCLI